MLTNVNKKNKTIKFSYSGVVNRNGNTKDKVIKLWD